MMRSHLGRKISYLSIVCVIFIICILMKERKTVTFLSWQIGNFSDSSPPPAYNLSKSYPISESYRNELINQRLLRYSRLYENASLKCDTSKPLSNQQNDSLLAISKLFDSFPQKLVPYPNEYFYGRGIVLTVGPNQLKYARVNLKMIGLTKTRLPVQIWYSVNQIARETMINLLHEAPKVNASVCCFSTNRCSTHTRSWDLNSSHIYKPDLDNLQLGFPFKPAAILSATFAEVLFLDCDAYVARDPEDLFLSDPMYLKFGAVFYPDAHKSRQHPLLWKILNTSCAQDEYELDSSTILVDKKRVWNGLYITKLINDNYNIFYNHVTDGDKDTFRFAFRYMNIKYYTVMIPCSTGSFDGTNFCGRTLCKTDSIGQHIYINHVHIFKYESVSYTKANLEYTRIGLGDLNDNLLIFAHCRLPETTTSCFHIMNKSHAQPIGGHCYAGGVLPEEIENEKYLLHQPLLYEKSKENRTFISKTSNLISDFADNLLQFLG